MWTYRNKEFNQTEAEGYFGFVYIITHIPTNRKYVGRKFFTKAGTKQVNGKKKKIRKVSDWQTYWSSSEMLQEEVKQNGEDQYTREILYLCKTKSELSYWETYEIFNRHALLNEHYYNSWCSCKIHKKHLGGIKQ